MRPFKSLRNFYNLAARFRGAEINGGSYRGGAHVPVIVDEAVDISQYDGSSIKIKFLFDTVDNIMNNSEGWYVDDVIVRATLYDAVTVTKAEYNSLKRALNVEAVSTQGGKAVLTVEGYGQMNYNSRKDIYNLIVGNVVAKPNSVTVNSSLEGTDTAPVSEKSAGGPKK